MARDDRRAPDLEYLAVQARERAWRRAKGPDRAFELLRGLLPPQPSLRLLYLVRVSDAVFRLCARQRSIRFQLRQHVDECVCTELGQPVVKATEVVMGANRRAALREYRASVQARIHAHDRDSGL